VCKVSKLDDACYEAEVIELFNSAIVSLSVAKSIATTQPFVPMTHA